MSATAPTEPKAVGLKLYGLPVSHPTRGIMWLCAMKNLKYKLVPTNTYIAEQLKPVHLKHFISNINPNGKIPAMEDTSNGLILFEGAAIMIYLCNKYKWEDMYPTLTLTTIHPVPHNHTNTNTNTHTHTHTDPPTDVLTLKRRARIDQYLHWHHENIRRGISFGFFEPILRLNIDFAQFVAENSDFLRRRAIGRKALQILNDRLLNESPSQLYIAGGDCVSIADIFCFEEIVQCVEDEWTMLSDIGGKIDGETYFKLNYVNIYRWIKQMQSLPCYKRIHSMKFSLKSKKYTQRKQEITDYFRLRSRTATSTSTTPLLLQKTHSSRL